MKSSHVKILAGLVLLAGQVSAQESLNSSTSSTSISNKFESNSVNGFQLGIRKGFSEKAKLKAKAGGATFTGSDSDFSHQFGLGVGWANHNFQSLGFKGGLNYDNFNGEDESFAAMNLEVNATVMVNQNFIPYAGANINKYVKGEGLKDMNAGLGYQLGVTGQIANQLSYQAAWQTINNDDSVDGISLDLRVSTIQVGLIYTL